jgi:hypothetical protein
MGYKTDQQRRAELESPRGDMPPLPDRAKTFAALDYALLAAQIEEGTRKLFYVIEEYHEPTNQRRQGYWEEVARIKWADLPTLPGIWDKLPGRKRIVTEDKQVIACEDFGQKLEIQIA